MKCNGCWKYNKCNKKNDKNITLCWEKGYTCKYCNNVICEYYDTETTCICNKYK